MLFKLIPMIIIITLSGCKTAHEVTIKQEEPLTINMNIRLEVSDEIMALLRAEKQQASVHAPAKYATKGLLMTAGTPYEQVEQLKTIQAIAETSSGYLATVPSARLNPEEQQVMQQQNLQRQKTYHQLAKDKGISAELVEDIAGKQRIEQEVSGRLVMDRSGQFVPKQ